MRGAVTARFGLGVWALSLPAIALAGTVTGSVEIPDKGGRSALDLSNVVVYVEGAPGKFVPPKTIAATIRMKGMRFSPHLAVIRVGGRVAFRNEDSTFHRPFSLSGNFDLGPYKRPGSKDQIFPHPGVIWVECSIHPEESAVIVVRDNPYFTRAARDGSFAIEGVPAGRYKLTAWKEGPRERHAGPVSLKGSTEVTVPATGLVESRLKLAAWKRGPNSSY